MTDSLMSRFVAAVDEVIYEAAEGGNCERDKAALLALIAEVVKDAERAEWMAGVLYKKASHYLVTDTGCGCCGESLMDEKWKTWREAIDAAREKEDGRE